MPAPFKMYRIVCTITDKSLVGGSDCPHGHWGSGQWYDRGTWSKSGATFWKTESAVRSHLQNLCHDWQTMSAPVSNPRWTGEHRYWKQRISAAADWSRLQHIVVEQFVVTDYSTTKLNAHDFMGIPEQAAA